MSSRVRRILIGLFLSFSLSFRGLFAASDYCAHLEKTVKNVWDLPSYCRPKNEYTAIKVAGGLAVFGAAAMLVSGYNSSSSGGDSGADAALPDDGFRHNMPRTRGPVDVDALNKILASPAYTKEFLGFSNFDDFERIGLSYSLARGWVGAGVGVAVLDTGAAGTDANPDPSYSFQNQTWHGTAVYNLIDQVAPEVEISAYRLTDDRGSFASYNVISGYVNAAAPFAAVINNSWGVPTEINGVKNINAADIRGKSQLVGLFGNEFLDSIRGAVSNNDVIFVWAAGNEGSAESNVISAIPRHYSDVAGNFINVVAYDTEREILADFSNACGVTKEYCLAAPGSDLVLEIFEKNNLEAAADYVASGTSFAAPIVSGAAAVIKSQYPFMSGAEITRLLFATAEDLGRPGVDEIYGWGLVDLERASRPVGNLSVGAAAFGAANALGDSAVAAAIAKADLSVMFTDSFGRGFTTKINDNLSFAKRPRSLDTLKKFGGVSGAGFKRKASNPFFLNNADADTETGVNLGDLRFNFAYQAVQTGPLESPAESLFMSSVFDLGQTEIELGFITENNSVMASNISGEWLNLGENSRTFTVGWKRDFDFGLSLRGNFGMIMPSVSDRSVIAGVSPILTSAFSAEYRVGDFSFMAARPLRVEKGALDLVIPVSQNDDGSLNYMRRKLSLRDNPAMEFGAYYNYENMSFGAVYSDREFMLLFRIKEVI